MLKDEGVLVDIETMSVHPSRALVLKVAAVKFTMLPAGPTFSARSAWRLPLLEQLLMNRIVDPGTQRFWLDQEAAAKDDLFAPLCETRLDKFFDELQVLTRDSSVFANGSHFDLTNLWHLAEALGRPEPWKYNEPSDVRTLLKHNPRYRTAEGHVEHLKKHIAIDDCVAHVWQLWEVWSWEIT